MHDDDTTYRTGDIVLANTNTQRLVAGAEYRVVDVHVERTWMGKFVTYTVTPVDQDARAQLVKVTSKETIDVKNGHLVLASPTSTAGQLLRQRQTASPNRPRVKLVGGDGNAFAVLGRCREAANTAGWPVEKWEQFQAEATSGDYDRLLATVQEHFDVD